MEATAKKTLGFGERLASMLRVDIRRMLTTPLFYIMAGVSLALPILILVMTSAMGGDAGASTDMFSNVWQTIGSVSGSAMGTDIASMCNINMLYFLIAVTVCLFVGDDFKSGYAKNLFTVRSKKTDYVVSKSIVCFACAAVMLLAYLVGAMIGGAIAGLPFATEIGAGGIVACLFSKIFLAAVFTAVALLLSVVAKQKRLLSILGSFAAGMLLFTVIPMIAPLDAGILNVIMCFAGGGLFAVGLGAASAVVLDKTNIV